MQLLQVFIKKILYSKLCCIVKFDELKSLAIFSCTVYMYIFYILPTKNMWNEYIFINFMK